MGEILLRNVKFSLRSSEIAAAVGGFNFTFCVSKIFHQRRKPLISPCDSTISLYSILNQLERSATSIGANIREANYAHSKPDFAAKLQISLKECYETEYWLELMLKAELLRLTMLYFVQMYAIIHPKGDVMSKKFTINELKRALFHFSKNIGIPGRLYGNFPTYT